MITKDQCLNLYWWQDDDDNDWGWLKSLVYLYNLLKQNSESRCVSWLRLLNSFRMNNILPIMHHSLLFFCQKICYIQNVVSWTNGIFAIFHLNVFVTKKTFKIQTCLWQQICSWLDKTVYGWRVVTWDKVYESQRHANATGKIRTVWYANHIQ